jgi:hypothetical protein
MEFAGDVIEMKDRSMKILSTQNILLVAFALSMYIQFSLIISFLVVDSPPMSSTSANPGDGHIGINGVKD